MALLTSRISRSIINPLSFCCRSYCKKEITIMDVDVITGKEKEEFLAYQAGDKDPFKLRAMKRKPNSKSDPIPVPSYYHSRVVGCICEEESSHVLWFWLEEGEPKRCYCGHWFKLQKFE